MVNALVSEPVWFGRSVAVASIVTAAPAGSIVVAV
jgi:hypothetical protein